MKKIAKFIMLMMTALVITTAAVSCSKDSENEPDPTPSPTPVPDDKEDKDDTDNISSDSNIKDLIAKYVKVNAEFKDFVTTIKIESSLHQHLKGKKIEFGVGHGDVNGTTAIQVGTQAFNYTERYSNNVMFAEIINPFYYYYMFGLNEEEEDMELFKRCKMYYDTYLFLLERGNNDLSEEEETLMNKCVNSLYEALDKIYVYDQAAYVRIDSKYYMVKKCSLKNRMIYY